MKMQLTEEQIHSNFVFLVRFGYQYIKTYVFDCVFDCVFAAIHFCFSGYFCACGKSVYAFLHNVISIIFVRIPGVSALPTLRDCFTDATIPTANLPKANQ